MEKVDLIIAGVGAVAILATVLGVVFYDEIDGNEDIAFYMDSRSVPLLGGDVTQADSTFQTAAGNNATAVALNVTVTFTGQSYNPDGDATVVVEFTDPTGATHRSPATVLPIPDGPSATPQTGTTVTVPMLIEFADAPADTEAEIDGFDMTSTWDLPYIVSVTVTPPGDSASSIPGGFGASYTFDAEFDLQEMFFYHQVKSIDVENV